MNIFDYIPNSFYKFFRWELPKYWGEANDGTEMDSMLYSPFARKTHAAWHQRPDSQHNHTLRYRILKSICDSDLQELKLALDENPFLINQPLQDGFTPLSFASSLNRVVLLDYLILRGADLEKLDEQGRTPLIQAVINWQIETIKHLTERGAQVRTKGVYGYDALQLARIRKYEQITKFLEIQAQQKIEKRVPPHQIQLRIEQKIERLNRILQKPEFPSFSFKTYPFNDYKGLYQVDFL